MKNKKETKGKKLFSLIKDEIKNWFGEFLPLFNLSVVFFGVFYIILLLLIKNGRIACVCEIIMMTVVIIGVIIIWNLGYDIDARAVVAAAAALQTLHPKLVIDPVIAFIESYHALILYAILVKIMSEWRYH